MKQNHIIGLGVLAIALLGAAVYVSESRKPAREAIAEGLLAPTLESRLNDVTEVRIKAAAGDAITLKRVGDRWTVAEKAGYRADTAELRGLLLKLAQARRTAAKTALPASYAVLGVEDIDAEGASSVLVTVLADAPLLEVILGQNNSRGAGTFVRLRGEPQSWLVDQNLSAEKTAIGWIKRELVDVANNRITAITLQPAQGEAVQIEAKGKGDGNFRLANLPKGREQASAYVADASAGFLSGLRIDDVQSADVYAAAEDAQITRADFLTREGVQISLQVHSTAAGHWAHFSAALDETVAAERIEGELARDAMEHEQAQEPAEPISARAGSETYGLTVEDPAASADAPLAITDPAAFRAERLHEMKAEVAALQQSFAGWVFKLPTFKADNLTRGMEDYLKPKA